MKRIGIIAVLGFLLGFASVLQAQQTCRPSAPESTPSADFTDNGDGTVTHDRTGLMWKRCAEGQTWSGGTCTGTASTAIWADALKSAASATAAGHSDWRLPNIKELQTIVEEKCYTPSINAMVFPNTPASFFWTSSTYASSSSNAWYVFFGDGNANSGYGKSRANQVRLVRAGQSFGSFDSANGTVTLTVAKTGVGSVSAPPVIDCGSTCTAKVGIGFPVTLTAAPAVNFIDWGGACAGTAASCTVTMDAAKNVTANFMGVPVVLVLPASLSFANQDLGTVGAAQSITLSNTGDAVLNIGSIVASGDFTQTNNCGAALGAGGSCSVSVSFTPTATGTRSGSVTITSNATGSPHTVAISGQGLAPTTTTTAVSTTTTTTAALTTTTTVATTTTTTQAATVALNFVQGWNLVGNGADAPIDVTATFSDANRFLTLWKWISAQSAWAFHAPSLAAQGGTTLADYAASKGYQLLTTIAGGEGFWVNAKQAGSVDLTNASAVSVTALGSKLSAGWNLAAVGETATPKQFCDAQSGGVTTLWAWDATRTAWYFYAPSLYGSSGLASYISSKGYLDFTTTNKTLGPGVGFWVNKP